MRWREVFTGSLVVLAFFTCNRTFSQLTPMEAVSQMGRGINIGNTLEPPDEGDWNNPPVQEYYFDDYVAAGFSTIRIPITWDHHTSASPPYTIDAAWMDRVAQIVDWGLSRKLFIIINAHHETWLKENPNPDTLARFDSIWSQIAARFQDRSDSLFFEMINEPYPMPLSTVDSLNARVLSIIRKTNPTRIVLFSGHMWSGVWELVQARVPDDDYLMGYFHSYDPWGFAGEGQGTWGSPGDVSSIAAIFDRAQLWTDDTGIPVIIGEFGAVSACDFNSRSYHYATYVEQALEHNIAFTVWDDGGWFRIYQRQDRDWNYLKNIIINFSALNPTQVHITNQDGESVLLEWVNRTSENDSILIQRGPSPTEWTQIARLANDISEYTDTDVETGETYYYRIVAHFTDTTDLLSYPVAVTASLPNHLAESERTEILHIYPNPAENMIQVSLSNGESVSVIVLYNLKGQVIEKNTHQGNAVIVPVSHLEKGFYLLEVQTNKNTYHSNFIKQ